MDKSACSVAATYKPPMLVVPQGSTPGRRITYNLQTRANDRVCFCRQVMKNMYIKDKTGE